MSRKKFGRNDPCPCGSGIKYKKCCLGKKKDFKVNPLNSASPIFTSLRSTDRGKTWQKQQGLLNMIVGMENVENVSDEIEEIFGEMNTRCSAGMNNIFQRLQECKHKVYALKYHLDMIKKEIAQEEKVFHEKYHAHSGVKIEVSNPVLIYETEAFLFQAKSNLDLITRLLGQFISSLKNFFTFKSSGERRKDTWIAGGKVISKLELAHETELAQLFETNRTNWIQKLVLYRDIITHQSYLKNFHCFIEEPNMGLGQIIIHYPKMPSGVKVDDYCDSVYVQLLQLYRQLFLILMKRI